MVDKRLEKELTKKPRTKEKLIKLALLCFGLISVCITIGIVLILGIESFRFFINGGISIVDFFTKTEWQPAI